MNFRTGITVLFALGLILPDSRTLAQKTIQIHDIVLEVKKVGPKGEGHSEAVAAMEKLDKISPAHFINLIPELNDANPIAANWIRGVIDNLVEQAVKTKMKMPVKQLEEIVLTTSNAARTRRTAFEILTSADPTAPDRLLPQMMNDPSLELRRDAIERHLHDTEKLAGEKKVAGYRVAFDAARDPDQVRAIAKLLRTEGDKVDLARKFGLLMDWHVIGHFDNAGKKGFDKVNPPEEKIDLNGSLEGLSGTVQWIATSATKETGVIDLNKPLGERKEVAGYAYTEFEAAHATDAQFRLACSCAVKVWLNGELIESRHIYHSNPDIDQYVRNVKLKAGTNTILLKVLQDEITESWAKAWQFSLRVCDDRGGAILAKNRKPTPSSILETKEEKKSEK